MDNSSLPVRIITKEKAIFWLDKEGYWRHRHEKFRHPKIIAHFHSCIQKDEHGYYLTQDHSEFREKVYFPYEDTALFVFEIQEHDKGIILTLNTGNKITLDPDKLFIENDHLYMDLDRERVKFSDRVLVTLSKYMQFDEEKDKIWINYQGRSWTIY